MGLLGFSELNYTNFYLVYFLCLKDPPPNNSVLTIITFLNIGKIMQWFQQFVFNIKQAIMHHPLEILLISICAMLAFFPADHFDLLVTHHRNFLATLPICFAIINLSRPYRYYWLTFLVPIFVAWAINKLEPIDILNDSRYWALLLCCAIYFVCENWQKNNRTFMALTTQKTFNILYSMAGSLVFSLAGFAIIAAIEALFSFYIQEARLWYFTWVWVCPVVYLTLVQRKNQPQFQLNAISELLLNWILSPALFIYTVIIYAYTFQILIQGKMPKGMIANVTFPYLIAGLIIQALQLLLVKEKWQKFYRSFTLLALLPLLMLWYATWIRIENYGITEDRVYLLIGVITLSLCYFLLLIAKLKQYRWVALLCISALIFSTFAIDAEKIGYQAQSVRLENFLQQHNLLNAQGNIDKIVLREWQQQAEDEQREELNTLFRYLSSFSEQQYTEQISKKYGIKEESLYSLVYSHWHKQEFLEGLNKYELKLDHSRRQFSTAGYAQIMLFPKNLYIRRHDSDSAECETEIGRKLDINLDDKSIETRGKCQPQDYILYIRYDENRPELVWNLDQFTRELFVQRHLDIKKYYSQQELDNAFANMSFKIDFGDVSILISRLVVVYDQEKQQGYQLRYLDISAILLK